MTTNGMILGSTRPGRNGEAVATWVHELASRRTDAAFELIDLEDVPEVDAMLDRVVARSDALAPLRVSSGTEAAAA